MAADVQAPLPRVESAQRVVLKFIRTQREQLATFKVVRLFCVHSKLYHYPWLAFLYDYSVRFLACLFTLCFHGRWPHRARYPFLVMECTFGDSRLSLCFDVFPISPGCRNHPVIQVSAFNPLSWCNRRLYCSTLTNAKAFTVTQVGRVLSSIEAGDVIRDSLALTEEGFVNEMHQYLVVMSPALCEQTKGKNS